MFRFVDPYKSQSAKAGAHSDIGLQRQHKVGSQHLKFQSHHSTKVRHC